MMEALRRGCESDPQSQQPAKTGGVCAAVQVYFFKIRRKSFVKESESVPATDHFWTSVCVCVFRVCNRMQKQTVQEAGME